MTYKSNPKAVTFQRKITAFLPHVLVYGHVQDDLIMCDEFNVCHIPRYTYVCTFTCTHVCTRLSSCFFYCLCGIQVEPGNRVTFFSGKESIGCSEHCHAGLCEALQVICCWYISTCTCIHVGVIYMYMCTHI